MVFSLQQRIGIVEANLRTGSIKETPLDPLPYFMSDEAWFRLSGHVNSQNTRCWSSENPHVIHERHRMT